MAETRDGEIINKSAGRRRALRLECRECEVICERVVSPWKCLRMRQTCVYAFNEGDSTYFGCIHKVFLPELDLGAFRDLEERGLAKNDPYGPVRVMRAPRTQCPVTIERAYCATCATEVCINPAFLREAFQADLDADERQTRPGSTEHGRLTA